jgi:sec-independent protein translocase protein TatC
VLAIFIVAAILTPPDPFTQVLMAIPMLVLYEVGILLAAAFGRKPTPATKPDATPDADPDSTGEKP